MKHKIWLSPPHLSGQEVFHIQSAINSQWITSQGPSLEAFEADIQNYLDTEKEVVGLNSGTSAIHLALLLLGVGEADVVICQSLTFVASVNPVLYLKATPVFIDSDRDSWNMCPILLEQAIDDLLAKGIQPKAIIAVHLYGMPYKINEIHNIAKKFDIPIIEDAAEALGSTYKGRRCGTFGDLSVFSFNGNKIITTSGGGALIVKHKKLKQQAIHLATQAKDNTIEYSHSKIGYNYRLSNLLAAVGRAQMQVLDERIQARRHNFNTYHEHLSQMEGIRFQNNSEHCESNRWLSCILLPSRDIRDGLMHELNINQIESRPIWKPMHTQKLFKGSDAYTNGISEDLFERGLCLPSGSNLKEEDTDRIITCIKNYLDSL